MQSGVIRSSSSAHSRNPHTLIPTTPTPTKTVPIQLKKEAEKIELRDYILKSNK
jgi:hypothetical protein